MSDLPVTIAAEDSGGSFLVSPNVGLMIWTLLVFGVSMWLLWRFAFPRISEALDRRQRAIEESIDASERTRREAEQLLQEYRERLAEAREQADEIVARARRTGESAEQETRRAIQQIRAEVADLTVLATEKVTRKTLTAEDQRRLVDEALSELDFDQLSGDVRRN